MQISVYKIRALLYEALDRYFLQQNIAFILKKNDEYSHNKNMKMQYKEMSTYLNYTLHVDYS